MKILFHRSLALALVFHENYDKFNSWTVLVIGPGPCLAVDAVTAHLRLL